MIRFTAPLIVFALLILVFIKGLDPDRNLNELPSPFLGKTAPAFDLPRLDDLSQRITNRDYDGEVVLVNFWATWCVGCRREHPFLMELSRENVVPIYGIDWRDQREPALEWLERLGNPYVASGFDVDAKTGIDWGVYGAPETYLISRDGRVLHKHLGPLYREAWETDFLPLIEAEKGTRR
ncbi:MAG: DsbE family thiol:disulfide interchange protein [Gammaproteobacteria bacterium]|nr:DsbE family thiol:disulfide interchange protein [Gammaproteobacteria bacterium]